MKTHTHQKPETLFLLKTLLSAALISLSTAATAQVSVTASAGTAGPTGYTTLKNAFDAINLGTHQGIVTVTVNANTTETATAVLNASGSGSSSYTKVVVKPGASATPTISGAIAGGPIISLLGASNVVIEGSNNGTNTRDLSIVNTTTTTPQVIVIGSVGTTAVTNDTVRNCAITNGAMTSSALIVSDGNTPGNAGYFNNIAIINNSVQKAYIGMYINAVVTGTNGNGTYVAKNVLNATGTNALRLVGIYLQGVSGGKVDSNTLGNFDGSNAEFDRGIWFATGTNNSSITGNTVSGLSYTGATAGYAPIGINLSPGISNASLTVTGNTVTNISSTSSGTSTGIYLYSAASGFVVEQNKVSNIKNSSTGGWGAAGIMLASSLTNASVSVVNNFVWDIAAYGTNSWAANSNGNGIVADAGGGYNIYHNTVWLNTNQTATTGTRAAAVLITTNITATNSINLRNNLLVNTQTVGNANSRMALVITANTNVMASFNYNDYYATSGNLAGQGTNATIWNTIAQIQTNMGGNNNSVSIAPTFTSATDLHLPVASNGSLNNLGVALASVPFDIDNDPRTSTPDMGADEFGNCQPVTITSQPTTLPFCAGSNTTLSVVATNANQVQWQVDNGSGFGNVSNGGVYSGATTGTLTLTNVPAGMNGYSYRAVLSFGPTCPQVISNPVTITVNPRPSVVVSSSGPTSFCVGGRDTLNVPSAGNTSYQWYNNGTAMSGETNNYYIALTAGNYSVVAVNSITGCTDTSASTAIAVGTGPAAVITPAGPNFVCQGKTITLSAGTTGGVTYQWYLNSNPISGATSNTLAASLAGSYTVVVASSPTCATTSAPSSVTVYPLPTATAAIFSGSAEICQGNTVTLSANLGGSLVYQWLSNGAAIPGATSNTLLANTSATYRVVVTNTFTTCSDTSSGIAIKVNPLPAATVSPTTPAAICERDTSLLSANQGTKLSYQWRLNGSSITGANAYQHKAYLNGVYSVEVTDSNNCRQVSSNVPLTVFPAPIATVTYSSPLEFCEGSAVALNAYQTPGVTYQWIKNGADLAGVVSPTNVVGESGNYAVRVVDANNCQSVSTIVPVKVFPAPVPVITRNGSLLSAGSYVSYQWFLNNLTIGNNGAAAEYPMLQNGVYKVVVVDTNGCEGTSESYVVLNLAAGSEELLRSVDVYPNPANSFVFVEQKGRVRVTEVSLLNGLGALVQSVQPQSNGNKMQISLTELPAGLYYLRITTEGDGVLVKKLTIAR